MFTLNFVQKRTYFSGDYIPIFHIFLYAQYICIVCISADINFKENGIIFCYAVLRRRQRSLPHSGAC